MVTVAMSIAIGQEPTRITEENNLLEFAVASGELIIRRLLHEFQCYSSFTLSWYLSLFVLTSHSYALWYVFLRLDTYSDSFEFFELFFC